MMMKEEGSWSTTVDLTQYPTESNVTVDIFANQVLVKGVIETMHSDVSATRREWSRQIRLPHDVNSSTIHATMEGAALLHLTGLRRSNNDNCRVVVSYRQ
jgi:HSP20 family molecular chaperone IbpA